MAFSVFSVLLCVLCVNLLIFVNPTKPHYQSYS